MKIRLNRLGENERKEALSLLSLMDNNASNDKIFARFGRLMDKADSCDPLPHEKDLLPCSADTYQRVWEEASKLRESGELLKYGNKIICPVVAIHGDYDPHPAEGVKVPLSRVIKEFDFILLEKCGHHPWLERNAQKSFYEVLRREIGQ